MADNIEFARITLDAQNTPYSEQFDDIYFMPSQGLAESRYVFLEGNNLFERWKTWDKPHFVIAETGFGTGLNFLACWQLFEQFRTQYPSAVLQRLFFISFEKYPLSQTMLTHALAHFPELNALATMLQQRWIKTPIAGCHRRHFGNAITLDLWLGDIHTHLPELGDYQQGRIDAWFLDGFAPSKNPEMWSESLYQHMARLSHKDTTFSTFTAASKVRLGLENVGFNVSKRKGFAHKREMLIGWKHTENTASVAYPWFAYSPANHITDIAIIGGGVASLFTALACIKRGMNVTLYCQDEALGQSASSNEQGALYPQLSDDDRRNCEIYAHSFLYAKAILPDLTEQLGEIEQGWHGVALCAYNCKVKRKLANIAAHWHPPFFELKTAQELTALCGVDIPHDGGFIPEAGWLSPRQLMQQGERYLKKCGVKIITNTHITHIESKQHNCWQLSAGDHTFTHECVILAGGHNITQFPQTAKLPLYPVRGQVSYISTHSALDNLKAVLCFDGYLTPRNQAGQHCLGASHVRDNTECYFSIQEQLENKARLVNNIPQPWAHAIDISTMQGNVGVRCGTRERLPIMGNVPHFERLVSDYANLFNLRRRKQPIETAAHYPHLYLLGALGSRGLTSAPLLGECLASLIANEPMPLAQSLLLALNPNRTWVRKLLKGAPVK
ncbi:bifunctional tRNA (5-methylaminomethyl-2-thiouridine)(34)-methyltransferase MnmD/FAD-dependent 5-carboxymethylaminomethyl-2-thiouridine(34) oxidoreductase MnmC [Spirabiliibacterium falconis]|uniref:bifunctional tRNA (5-methylaminomethyl-2-thiouridine)(34)-methyltransferase MnmD/FAD-dependent 5-carboxymethylaminomethyl-2-thiouridine(34) oxidoreductase MnmC n=1 Tax=Spirabiliibacterium falconis TaxID=572023 RepID=UPI001AACAFDB|nr:bifunctional tRNA (5-methylaminomethyl-2-thiouridine)(34)-methyltransferase MnmD/FAD-dependent 5-carboxymethylaminomethyl-2-thiouridine(34) oxidoreductase MnmC [Spirabiliibacterium falconis]MBE2894018.1 bifunctional tRNA (5-methylaminomethyl-2-thiouridine)(34)-methyltransferase MnmD/FAD-dependent 5-carboxymethylaminomethyl-2-thiouridine(34) oxidoreductase MnmC [Spirabiliibacterium falconis]